MPAAEEIHEASRKSGVVWVAVPGLTARAVWHVWHDGADHVLVGGGEQELPGLAETTVAEVTVPAKRVGAGRVTWTAAVASLVPGSDGWEAVEPLLRKARLHAEPDPTARWRAHSTLLRLTPL